MIHNDRSDGARAAEQDSRRALRQRVAPWVRSRGAQEQAWCAPASTQSRLRPCAIEVPRHADQMCGRAPRRPLAGCHDTAALHTHCAPIYCGTLPTDRPDTNRLSGLLVTDGSCARQYYNFRSTFRKKKRNFVLTLQVDWSADVGVCCVCGVLGHGIMLCADPAILRRGCSGAPGSASR